MPIRTHSFRGKSYRIDLEEHVDGFSNVPGPDDPYYIYVSYRLEGTRSHLEILIHEAMHAEDPDATEADVERRAKSIARFLWRVGYRLQE